MADTTRYHPDDLIKLKPVVLETISKLEAELGRNVDILTECKLRYSPEMWATMSADEIEMIINIEAWREEGMKKKEPNVCYPRSQSPNIWLEPNDRSHLWNMNDLDIRPQSPTTLARTIERTDPRDTVYLTALAKVSKGKSK